MIHRLPLIKHTLYLHMRLENKHLHSAFNHKFHALSLFKCFTHTQTWNTIMDIFQQGIVLLIPAYYEHFKVTQTIQEVTTGFYVFCCLDSIPHSLSEYFSSKFKFDLNCVSVQRFSKMRVTLLINCSEFPLAPFD